MNQTINPVEIVDLEADRSADVGVELSDLELQDVSGGYRWTWKCGHPQVVDEWQE